MPLSEGRFAAKCPLSPQKWRSPRSNRKKNFAEIQKTEGKPCRDLDQDEAIPTLIEYQGRISIMYAVGRHSAFQGAQRAFRSNRLSHEIGRRTLPRGKRLLPFAQAVTGLEVSPFWQAFASLDKKRKRGVSCSAGNAASLIEKHMFSYLKHAWIRKQTMSP